MSSLLVNTVFQMALKDDATLLTVEYNSDRNDEDSNDGHDDTTAAGTVSVSLQMNVQFTGWSNDTSSCKS